MTQVTQIESNKTSTVVNAKLAMMVSWVELDFRLDIRNRAMSSGNLNEVAAQDAVIKPLRIKLENLLDASN